MNSKWSCQKIENGRDRADFWPTPHPGGKPKWQVTIVTMKAAINEWERINSPNGNTKSEVEKCLFPPMS